MFGPLLETDKANPNTWNIRDIEEAVTMGKIKKAHLTNQQIEEMFIHQDVKENDLSSLSNTETKTYLLMKAVIADKRFGVAPRTTATMTLQEILLMPKAFFQCHKQPNA